MNHWPTYNVKYLGELYDVSVDFEEALLVAVEQNGEDVWDELDQKDLDRLYEKALQEAKEQAEDARAESRFDDWYHGC
jgi:nucleotide-binding universal stress UspA family protein